MKEVPLTQGKVALVSDWQYDTVRHPPKWLALKSRKTFYAARSVRLADGRKTTQYMHRLLLPDAPKVDHKDRNGLNNQDHNLRPATTSLNAGNAPKCRRNCTSKFKGVSFDKRSSKWKAQIKSESIHKQIGLFASELDAARAYDAAAIKHFGEFACTNAGLGLIPTNP